MKREFDPANLPAPAFPLGGARGEGFVAVALATGLVFAWVIAWNFQTARDMARVWWNSDTYAHGMIVVPVFAWLLWRARPRLAGLRLRPEPWFAVPIVLAGLLWLMGRLVGVAAASHFALVATLVLALVGVLGRQVARVLMFPLAFLMFAVPIGDFLLPGLMNLTASFTVQALRLTGVPVYREGLFFVVPNGSWSVVEACSGIRYLIASATVGALYAYLSFSSLRRRLLFMAAALLVPILANWLRAYMIVLLGYLTDNRLAAGVDHLIYGWVFFGVVMMGMFALANRWREPLPAVPLTVAGVVDNSRPVRTRWVAVLPVLLAVALLPVAAAKLDGPVADYSLRVDLPAAARGWTVDDPTSLGYRPRYLGARGQEGAVYRGPDGRPVLAYVAWYAEQRDGREMVGWGNGVVDPGSSGTLIVAEREIATGIGPVRETRLKTAEGPVRVWRWYRVNGLHAVGDIEVKLRLAVDRLTAQGDGSAVIVLATRETEAHEDEARLRQFLSAHAAGFDATVEALAAGGGAR